MAAIWLLEREVKHCTIGFYVDSQSALRDLDAVGCNKITVYRAKEALKELSLLNTVTLTWVKAHRKGKDKASEANERADAAARLATSIEPAGSIEAPLALAGAKAIIKAKIWADWKEEWDSYKEARQSHYFLDGPSTKFNCIYKYCRTTIGRLVQYISGHAFLRRHNRIIEYNSKENDGVKECRLCLEDDETPHHIITNCPALARERTEAFHTWRLPAYFNQWSPHQMISFLDNIELIDLESAED